MFWKTKPDFEWIQHINPDGSVGGFVAKGANVGGNVTLGRTSFVLPGAKVNENEVVRRGVIVTEHGQLPIGAMIG